MKSAWLSKLKQTLRPSRAAERTLSTSPSAIPTLLRKAAASGGTAFEVGAAIGPGSNSPTLIEADTGGRAPKERIRPLHYQIGTEIGHGGMGSILRAKDLNIQRTVAMKVILSEKQNSEHYLLRFLQEAQLTGQLEHPNIVPVHELGTDERGKPFYTMKFVHGITLHEVLERIKAGDVETTAVFSLAHLLTIFQKVCDAVAFAHSRGVVHRDLKPENIMLGDYGEVLVMDWGLAKLIEDRGSRIDDGAGQSILHSPSSGLTLSGQIIGTPRFMAPEQAEGKLEEIDARTDIFALGGILYSILTLRQPVGGDSMREIIEKVKTGNIPRPTSFNPKETRARHRAERRGRKQPVPVLALPHCPDGRVPESLSAVAMKALAVRREDRYQTVQKLQKEIEAYQGGFATSAEQAHPFKLFLLLIQRHKIEFMVSQTALLVIAIIIIGSLVKVTRTLNELEGTAPEFYAQASILTEQSKFEEALQKISYAIQLVPNQAEYHFLRGNLCQSLLRLADARDAYQAALSYDKAHAGAEENLKVCAKILQENTSTDKLMLTSLHELYQAMRRQERYVEAQAMMRKLGKQTVYELSRRILDDADVGGILQVDDDGLLNLNLNRSNTEDLAPLKGLPLRELHLHETKVRDLTPLKGTPLRMLSIENTRVTDISVLKGMPLERLYLSGAPIRDFSPLKGLPLQLLALARQPFSDLNLLRGMPLHELVLTEMPVSDLRPLRGMALESLGLYGLPAQELSPLQGTPLKILILVHSAVSDLTPLKGMPLEMLVLEQCPNIRDLSPVSNCTGLKNLCLPKQCANIEFLRDFPNLITLDYEPWASRGGFNGFPTPAEFWKKWDAKKVPSHQN